MQTVVVYKKKCSSFFLTGVFWLIISSLQVYAQCHSIRGIIDSELPDRSKVDKIAAFVNDIGNIENDSIADCYHDLGYRWYFKNWMDGQRENDLRNALKYTSKAIEVKRKLKPIDTLSLRQSMYNLAYFQQQSGDFYDSGNTYREIITFSLKDDFEYYTKSDLGLMLVKRGEYNEALDQFRDAVHYSEKIDQQWDLLLLSYINLANCYGKMGYVENRDSISHYVGRAKALVKEKKLFDSYEDKQISIVEGNLFLRTERYEEAIECYQEVIDSEFSGNQIPEIVFNNLGFCQLKAGDTIRSKFNLLKSIEIDSNYSDPYENLGDLYFEKKDFHKGLLYYQRAIERVTGEKDYANDVGKLPNSESLELASNKLSLLNHLTTKANAWLRYYKEDGNKGHLTHALATFKKADELIDIIKRENTEFKSKLYWREQSSKLYARAVEACYHLKDPETAFYFMERNKALLLLEDLTHERAKELSNLPDSLARRDFELKQDIALSEGLLKNHNLSSVAQDSLKNGLFKKKREYRLFLENLVDLYPTYATHKNSLPIIDYAEFKRDYTNHDRAVLHYILADTLAYGLLTTEKQSEFFRVGNNDFTDKLTDVIAGLNTHMSLNANKHGPDNSKRVFLALFPKKVYERIRGRSLLIIPDGILQQLPFGALSVASEEPHFLMEEADIGYAYSVSLLNQLNTKKYRHETALSAFAPIDFNAMGLSPLTFSGDEANKIANFTNGAVYSEQLATVSEFGKQLQKSGIVHLATHADASQDGNGWIAFSDRKLFLDEIYALQSGADMVALSACKTSAGDISKGEGVMSIARGLFNIGTKSVLSTLWAVDEVASEEIIVDFYRELQKGLTKSEALQRAKLNYLAKTEEPELRHPYYWAGFITLGDNSPLSYKPASPWLLLGLGLIGTGVLVFGYKKIKGRKAV